MMNSTRIASVVTLAGLLAGCSSLTNGRSVTPTTTQTNLTATSKAQISVGTAQLADGTLGLNVVATFRQANGLSATLVNTPSITGPSGFVVPKLTLAADQGGGNTGQPTGAGGSGTDGGTATMSGTAQQAFNTPAPTTTPAAGTSGTTFGQNGGVFASGIAPFNAQQSTNPLYPGSQNVASGFTNGFRQPLYAATYDPVVGSTVPFIVGPPAVPFFNDGTQAGSFTGYLSGFTSFKVAPVIGTYTLNIAVAAANAGATNFTATGAIKSVAPLPVLPAPVFVGKTAAGGATWTVAVPADARIVETMVFVIDQSSSGSLLFYSVGPTTGTGTLTFALPGSLGTCTTVAVGCNLGANAGPTITTGDTYIAYAASFDYPQFEAEPPTNLQQTPVLAGSAGQSDITLSPTSIGTY